MGFGLACDVLGFLALERFDKDGCLAGPTGRRASWWAVWSIALTIAVGPLIRWRIRRHSY